MLSNDVLISGAPYRVGDIFCRQPTLGDIYKDKNVGHDVYLSYLYVISMTVDRFLETTGMTDTFSGLSPEEQSSITIWDLLTFQPSWRSLTLEALNFFVDGEVVQDSTSGSIAVRTDDEKAVPITAELYEEMRRGILQCAGIHVEEAKPKGFYNNAARKLYEKSLALKKSRGSSKSKADANYDAWNIIGAVSARHPSYNLLNIWGLTVYQLYDQFARMQDGVQFDGVVCRWAVWGKDKFDFSAWFKKGPADTKH